MKFQDLIECISSPEINVATINFILNVFSPKRKLEFCQVFDSLTTQYVLLLKDGENYYFRSAAVELLKKLFQEGVIKELNESVATPPIDIETNEKVTTSSPIMGCQCHEHKEQQIIIAQQKPILMEIKIAFEDHSYTFIVDDLSATYTLDTFCKVQILYVPKARLELIVHIDKKADLKMEQKKQDDFLEILMHDPNTKLQEFKQALLTSEKLLKSAKFQSWVVGKHSWGNLEFCLNNQQKIYDKTVKLYGDNCNLDVSANVVFKDESLLSQD